MFSFVAHCQGQCGSHKYTSNPTLRGNLATLSQIAAQSHLSDKRKESGKPAHLSIMASSTSTTACPLDT